MAPAATARPEENSGGGGDTEVVPSTSSPTEQNRLEEVETNSDATSDRSGNKKKAKSRAQQEREELADRIINFAEKEDHPVDLELAALGAKIKRKLPDLDDQDDLMDEIKDCARAFFQNKRRAKTTTPPPGNAGQRNVVQAPPPPPPLQLYGQQQEQQQQMMFNPVNSVDYVTDATTGATLMAL